MPRSLSTLLALTAALVALPAAPALAEPPPHATMKFDATLEVHRTVAWDAPRIAPHSNCQGAHYVEANGSEDWQMKATGRVLATTAGRQVTWHTGRRWLAPGPLAGKAVIKREWTHRTGSTGGWCGGGQQDPPLENDCGTRLVPFTVTVNGSGAKVDWQETRGSAARERYDFYRCTLITPQGVPVGSFPRLSGKISLADLRNRRKRTIVVKAAKAFGPDLTPLVAGVNRTASASMQWKLTLKRR